MSYREMQQRARQREWRETFLLWAAIVLIVLLSLLLLALIFKSAPIII